MNSRINVVDVYNITGIGPVLVGNITEGVLYIGMKTSVSGKTMTVKSIEAQHKSLEQANPGDNIGIAFAGGDYKLLKSCSGKDLEFSGDLPNSQTQKNRNNPKFGFFQSLFRRF